MAQSLQNNRIQKLTGFATLVKLQKLYVEDNEISCVEGLENCTSLQELHLSRQRLPAGVALEFDPGCLEVCPQLTAAVWKDKQEKKQLTKLLRNQVSNQCSCVQLCMTQLQDAL